MPRKLKPPVFEGLPICELETAFRNYLQAANRSPATIAQYSWAIRTLDAYLARKERPRNITDISTAEVAAFQADLLARRTPATADAARRALTSFWAWAVEDGEAPANVMLRVPKPSVPVPPVPVIPPEWARRLFAACSGTAYEDVRDLAILRLLWDSGGRRAEIGGLKVADLHWETNIATVTGKGARVRTIPYLPRTAQALRRYLTKARPRHPDCECPALWLGANGPMTPDGIRHVLDKRTGLAGLPHLNPHQFRHTLAHRYLAAGGNQNNLMLLMGWSSPQMVARYVKSTATELAHSEYNRLELDDV